jgi:multidrug efflux pump subunit AcrB
MIAAALSATGGLAAGSLPLDLVPAAEYPRCTIVTGWYGRPPEDVERRITAPIEAMAQSVRGVRTVSSVSHEGLSVVDVEMDRRRLPRAVRSELRDRLADPDLGLPPEAEASSVEEYLPPTVRDVRGFMVFVVSGSSTLEETGMAAQQHIAPVLRSVPGVAAVDVLGMPRQGRRLRLHQDALQGLGRRGSAVAEAVGSSVVDSSLQVRILHGMVWSVTSGVAPSPAAMPTSAAIGRTPHGRPLTVGSLAAVADTLLPPAIEVRLQGRPAVVLQIDRQVGTNALTVSRLVRRRAEEIGLPGGVDLRLHSDRTRGIEREARRMGAHATAACAAVFLLLLASLRSPVQAAVVMSVPLVSAGTALLILSAAGIGLHLFSMAGLLLGVGRLVDDAVVVVHHLRLRARGVLTPESAAGVMPAIALPVCASSALALGALSGTVVAPEGIRGLLVDFSIAAGASLAVSCAASLTLVPALLCAAGTPPASGGPRCSRHDWYANVLGVFLDHPRIVVAGAILLFGIPLWLLPYRIPGESLPSRLVNQLLDTRVVRQMRSLVEPAVGGSVYLFAHAAKFRDPLEEEADTRLVFWTSLPRGAPRGAVRDIALRVEQAMLDLLPSGQGLMVQIGPEYCAVVVEFDETTAASALPQHLRARLVNHASALPVGSVAVSGFGPGYSAGFERGATFAVRIAGYRYDVVRSLATALGERLRAHPRVSSVDTDRSFDLREDFYEVKGTPDLDRLARAGLPGVLLATTLREELAGDGVLHAGESGKERVPVLVVNGGVHASDLAVVRSRAVRNNGRTVGTVSQLVDLRVRRTPARIVRERQQYVCWMTLEYRGPEEDGARWVDQVLEASAPPPGYSAERQRSRDLLAGGGIDAGLSIGALSLLVSWLIAAAAYESFALSTLVLLSAPMSLIGIFVAFPLSGIPFGRGGVMACVLLIGIVGANAVVLVDRLRPPRGGGPLTRAQIIEGAGERLQPVMITACATLAGIAPLLVMEPTTSPGFSLAFGMAAGLVSGTILTLVLLPVVVAMVTSVRRPS